MAGDGGVSDITGAENHIQTVRRTSLEIFIRYVHWDTCLFSHSPGQKSNKCHAGTVNDLFLNQWFTDAVQLDHSGVKSLWLVLRVMNNRMNLVSMAVKVHSAR